MGQKLKISALVLSGLLTLLTFQNCANNDAATGDVISELNSIDNSDLGVDEDVLQDIDENEAQDFQTSARAHSGIPAVNYMYTSSVRNGYVHIRFRCPVNANGVLYRNFKVYYNGRYWYKFTSGCRSATNSRSVRFRSSWTQNSGKHEIRFVTGSRFEGNDDYSADSKRECYENFREVDCN